MSAFYTFDQKKKKVGDVLGFFSSKFLFNPIALGKHSVDSE